MEFRRSRNERGLYQLLVQAVQDTAIFALDLQGCVMSWNAGAERITGYTAEEILGRHFSIFYPPHARDEGRPEYALEVVSREGRYAEEGWRIRKDGSRIWADIVMTTLRDENGEPVGFAKTTRDVTERKKMDERLRHAKEVAERASQAKNDLLSRTSHELRTPLNAILGFGQFLEADPTVADQESVRQILSAGRHLLSLVDDVLDLAALEAGRINLSLTPVRLSDVLQQSVDLLRHLGVHRRITMDAERALSSDYHVLADPRRLKQVVLNLLSNAIKYNREGGTVFITCEEVGDGWIRVAVRDTGPGIPEEKLDQLFVPFERLTAEQEGVKGTGLGLVLSKGLVESMRGRLGVESVPGVGSTFWIELPRAEPSPDEMAAAEVVGAEILPPEAASVPSVLYIDDNLVNLRLVERILSRYLGARLLSAVTGKIGMEMARLHKPRLILLDLLLPDLTGREILEQLQRDPTTRDIPVVIVSSDADPEHIGHALVLGASAYLTKPLSLPEFVTVMKEHLGGSS